MFDTRNLYMYVYTTISVWNENGTWTPLFNESTILRWLSQEWHWSEEVEEVFTVDDFEWHGTYFDVLLVIT